MQTNKLQSVLDELGVVYQKDQQGNFSSSINRKTLEFTQRLVDAGASSEDIMQILTQPSIESGLADLDIATQDYSDSELEHTLQKGFAQFSSKASKNTLNSIGDFAGN